MDERILKLIDDESEWLEFFESKVTYHDNIRNAYGIYSLTKNRMEANGHYEYKEMPWTENGVTQMKRVRDYYVPNNPDKINIHITDHYGLLTPEKDDNNSLYEAVGKYSSRYSLEFRDLWKMCVVGVAQQAPTSEQQQYTMIGGTILDKVKPTPDGLGTNKSIAQNVNLMLTLFHPARYNQKEYGHVDLKRMNDSYRELFININRDGINNVGLDLYFNGACNYFEELPLTREKMEPFYKRLELNKNIRNG